MKLARDKRGSYSLEALFNLPVLLMLLLFIVEMGFLMYDWAVINYAVNSSAALAAKESTFTATNRAILQNYIKQWTSSGKNLTYTNVNGTSYTPNPSQAIIYGNSSTTYVQYGQPITVGICYPYKFKTFIVDAMSKWFVQDNQLYLKVQAVATSEVYRE